MNHKSVLGRGPLGTSLLLILPLFLVYEVGLLLSPFGYNGVDLITPHMADLAHHSRGWFLLINLALASGLGLVIYLQRDQLTLRHAALTVGESVLWAVAMAGLTFLVVVAFGVDTDPHGVIHLRVIDAIVASCGAGFHEELVFRLGIMCGGAWVLKKVFGQSHQRAMLIAIVGSSMLFAAAHHIGPGSQPFALYLFVDRTVAGLLLGTITYRRSLAHAVYAHAIFDLAVFLFVS